MSATMNMEEDSYQEVVYILREDGTVEEKFTLPDRADEGVGVGQNFNHVENVVNVADILAPPTNVNINAKAVNNPNNFSTVTLVNERGEEITSCPPSTVGINNDGNIDTQIFHLNGLEQLSFDGIVGSNFNTSTLNQVPQQLMELDDTVINSDNVNIFELGDMNDIQLLASPESPNKFIINTFNLNNSNTVYSTNSNIRPAQTHYSFNVPRTYAKNPKNMSKPRAMPVQGVSQLLLAHEMSKDQTAPIIIANARSVTQNELDWIKSPGDKDEFYEEANPDVITYGTTEVTTAKEQSVNYVYHDSSSSVPLHVSFVVESAETRGEQELDNEVKLDNPLIDTTEESVVDADVSARLTNALNQSIEKAREEQEKFEKEVETELQKLKPKRKRKQWLWCSLDDEDELLRNFKRRPNKSKKWICGVCYGWFDEKDNLDKHFRETHFKTAKFQKCRFCDKKFLARFLCLRHEKTHDKKIQLKRPLQWYFLRNGKPSSFFRKIRKPAPLSEEYTGYFFHYLKNVALQPYECIDCDAQFRTDVEARDHYDLTHAIQECVFCYKKLDNMTKLEEHLSEVHEFYYLKSFPSDYWSLQQLLTMEHEGKRDDTIASRVEFLHPYAKNPDLEPPERRNYFYYLKRMQAAESEEKKTPRSNSKCRFLRKKPQMPKLALPGSPAPEVVKTESEDGPPPLKKESPYECKICFDTFPTDTEFSNHIKIKHSYEVKPKPFPCTFCDKKFATHSNRKEHERIHTQEKNYVCPFCNKAFIQISNLKKHVTTHKDQNLKCNTCDKQFITKNSLILHQRAHAADRKFRCNLCDRAYNYASLLKRHMRIHTGECPYECDICFQPFHELVSLHYHRKKVHTGERPHKCDICGKAFILSSDLKKHSTVHNKTDPNAPPVPKTSKPGRLPRSKRTVEQHVIDIKTLFEPKVEEEETTAVNAPADNKEGTAEAVAAEEQQ